MKETILYSNHLSLLRQVQDLEYRSNQFVTSLLRSCCVTRPNNGCEGNNFLTRFTVNVEPISLIRKVTKRIKRQLDMSLNAECETVHMIQKKKKKLVRNAYTCPARDNVLRTRGPYFLISTVTARAN